MDFEILWIATIMVFNSATVFKFLRANFVLLLRIKETFSIWNKKTDDYFVLNWKYLLTTVEKIRKNIDSKVAALGNKHKINYVNYWNKNLLKRVDESTHYVGNSSGEAYQQKNRGN